MMERTELWAVAGIMAKSKRESRLNDGEPKGGEERRGEEQNRRSKSSFSFLKKLASERLSSSGRGNYLGIKGYAM